MTLIAELPPFTHRIECRLCGYTEDTHVPISEMTRHEVYHTYPCFNYAGDAICDSCYLEDIASTRSLLFFDYRKNNAIAAHSRLENAKKSATFFGIEIETASKRPKILKMSHEDEVMEWEAKNDASLKQVGSVEFASIPMEISDESFRRVEKFLKLLRDHGYGVDRTCGLHLHLNITKKDARNAAFLINLVKGYYHFENILLSMLPKSRQHNSYCLPINPDRMIGNYESSKPRLPELKEAFYECGRRHIKILARDHYFGKRYFGLNLHSIFYRGSLELRYHSGTLDYKKIRNWVLLNAKIVRYIRKKTRRGKEADFRELRTLDGLRWTVLKDDPDLVAYVKKRQENFKDVFHNSKHFWSTRDFVQSLGILGDFNEVQIPF